MRNGNAIKAASQEIRSKSNQCGWCGGFWNTLLNPGSSPAYRHKAMPHFYILFFLNHLHTKVCYLLCIYNAVVHFDFDSLCVGECQGNHFYIISNTDAVCVFLVGCSFQKNITAFYQFIMMATTRAKYSFRNVDLSKSAMVNQSAFIRLKIVPFLANKSLNQSKIRAYGNVIQFNNLNFFLLNHSFPKMFFHSDGSIAFLFVQKSWEVCHPNQLPYVLFRTLVLWGQSKHLN